MKPEVAGLWKSDTGTLFRVLEIKDMGVPGVAYNGVQFYFNAHFIEGDLGKFSKLVPVLPKRDYEFRVHACKFGRKFSGVSDMKGIIPVRIEGNLRELNRWNLDNGYLEYVWYGEESKLPEDMDGL